MKNNLIILLLYIFISLIPLVLIYYDNDFRIVIFHDSPYPLNSKELAYLFFYIWRDNFNFGIADVTGIPLSLFYLFIYILETITVDKALAQILLLFILNLLALYSIYLLAKDIGLNNSLALVASLLYSFNPYSLYYCWRIFNTNIFLYSVFPLYILSINKIYRDKKYKYVVLILISTVIAYPSFTNPAFFLSLFVALLIYLLTLSVLIKKSLIETFATFIIIIFPIFTLTFPVYTNLYFAVKENNIFTKDVIHSLVKIYEFNTHNVTLLNLFTLTAMPPVYENIEWYPFQDLYKTNNFTIALGLFIVFMLTLSSIIQKNRLIYDLLPYISLFLFASFFTFNNEFGHYIFSNLINLLAPWRDPYHKLGFIIALSLSLIFSKSLQLLIKLFAKNNYIRLFIYLLVMPILLFYLFPFFTLNFIPESLTYENTIITPFTQVIYDYSRVIEILKNDNSFNHSIDRILVYPFTNTLWCENGYLGSDILRLYGFNTISTLSHTNSLESIKFLENILENVTVIRQSNFVDIISRLGVKYILIRKQTCQRYLVDRAIVIKTILENKSNIIKVLETERFALFKIKNATVSRFAILTTTTTEDSNLDILNVLLTSRAVVASKVDPSTWELNVSSDTPFYLIFANSYDQYWEAYIYKNGTLVRTIKPISFYGIFNAFWINETGNLYIVVKYKLQEFFILFLLISFIFLSIFIFFIFHIKGDPLQ